MSIKNIVLTNNSGDFILPVTSAENIRDIPCKDALEKAYADVGLFGRLLDLYNSSITLDDFNEYEKQAYTSSYVYFKIKNNSSGNTFDKLFNAFNYRDSFGTDYAEYSYSFYDGGSFLASIAVMAERSYDAGTGATAIIVSDPTITQGWTILEASSFVLPVNGDLFSPTTFNDKQDTLVSGTNIKTVNNQSILGSGNITIDSGSDVEANPTLEGDEDKLTSLEVDGVKYKLDRPLVKDLTDGDSFIDYHPRCPLDSLITAIRSGEPISTLDKIVLDAYVVYIKYKHTESDDVYEEVLSMANGSLEASSEDEADWSTWLPIFATAISLDAVVQIGMEMETGEHYLIFRDFTIAEYYEIVELKIYTAGSLLTTNALQEIASDFDQQLEWKQNTLESGVNIKTINSQSILGSGDIQIASGTEVVANPTLVGTEGNLDSIQINGVKYKLVTRAEFDWLVNSVQALAAQSGHSLAMASYQDGTNTTLTGEDQSGNSVPIVYEDSE